MQLKLSRAELTRLANQIQTDYHAAESDHSARIERFRRYYRMWRNRVDAESAPTKKGASNYRVPLLQWHIFGKWAGMIEGLLGNDAKITCAPVGPSDERSQRKAEAFINWRVFHSMKLTTPMSIFTFRELLFGRSIAYAPWVRERYWKRDLQANVDVEEIWRNSPGFQPLHPDDIIVPAEDVQSIQDFSFVIHKGRLTPQQFLDEERAGRFFGVKENWDKFLNWGRGTQQRDHVGDHIKREQDAADGITMEYPLSAGTALPVRRWYGRWRLPKGADGGEQTNSKKRRMDESELLVTFVPDLDLIVGVEDLMDLYPLTKDRRPFVEASLVKDGSYWSMGLGEMLEMMEDELTNNHRLFDEAGQFSVGPVIFYKPGSGFNPDTYKYEPFSLVPTDSPQDIKAVNIDADMSYPIAKAQEMHSTAERVTGVTEMSIGRAQAQPNAPRTATGQMAMIEAGNMRVALDLRFLREDFKGILQHFWQLDQQFAGKEVFFRVTEEEAGGLFDVRQGGALMTADELAARYDFDIKFSTSYWQREAESQRALNRYQLDLANPLILQNPRALWKVTNDAHIALGDRNFGQLVPEPPDPGLPKNPAEEWTLMLQGEEVQPNPLDNDDFHIMTHLRQAQDQKASIQPDAGALQLITTHIAMHQAAKRQKMLMQAMAAQVMQNVSAAHSQVMTPIEEAMRAGVESGPMDQLGPMFGVGGPPNGAR